MRVYFKGHLGTNKSLIINLLHDRFIKDNIKCIKIINPIKKWKKALYYKYNHKDDYYINNISNYYISLSMFIERMNINYNKDTIYLIERDIDCCKAFLDFNSEASESLNNDILTEMKKTLNNKFNNTLEYTIYINSKDLHKNLCNIKNRNISEENNINIDYLENIEEKLDKTCNLFIADINTEFDKTIDIIYQKILYKFKNQ